MGAAGAAGPTSTWDISRCLKSLSGKVSENKDLGLEMPRGAKQVFLPSKVPKARGSGYTWARKRFVNASALASEGPEPSADSLFIADGGSLYKIPLD